MTRENIMPTIFNKFYVRQSHLESVLDINSEEAGKILNIISIIIILIPIIF